jgi:hypothetical protein
MNSSSKVILYIKDVPKPIIVTCSNDKKSILQCFVDIPNTKCHIEFDSGDIVMLPKGIDSINAIFITEEKE